MVADADPVTWSQNVGQWGSRKKELLLILSIKATRPQAPGPRLLNK